MSNTVKYCQSATLEPYESALMPECLISEEYQTLTEEHATMEEKYMDFISVHEEWMSAKVKEVHLVKLKLNKEVWLEKLRILKLEEEQKAEEKWKKDEHLCLLKEQQEAKERQKLADMKVKANEAAQLKKKERKDKEIEKRKKKKEKKKAKVVMESSSEKETNTTEAALGKEEKGTDGDTEEWKSGTSKEQALKRLRDICDVLKLSGEWRRGNIWTQQTG
ncbi:hypothetical protein EDD85DRAFT_788482 [Armillaria nabsnona]|nr:hypothetical protein EDD85DRAFT_788482 [Armillaria nabsnona]